VDLSALCIPHEEGESNSRLIDVRIDVREILILGNIHLYDLDNKDFVAGILGGGNVLDIVDRKGEVMVATWVV
jgi:hypothetical protein